MIILSYRRNDTGQITGRIFDSLEITFGRGRVYMDIDSIPAGVNFKEHIEDTLASCNALVAVIGPNWLGKEDGLRRIDNPQDFVRMEVAQALKRGTRIIPLLIDNTEIPSPDSLPEELKSLSYLSALRVDTGSDFRHHMERLCAVLREARNSRGTTRRRAAPRAEVARRIKVALSRPHAVIKLVLSVALALFAVFLINVFVPLGIFSMILFPAFVTTIWHLSPRFGAEE